MFSGEASSELVERWQWTYPIIFSPVDPKVLYTGSQHVWKTTNGGQTLGAAQPDLTRHDPKTMGAFGGPITGDMNGPEVYAVDLRHRARPRRDVNMHLDRFRRRRDHVTRDGGKTWTNVTPKDMPEFGRVSIIDASSFDVGDAPTSPVKRPLMDDKAPYIFRTHDFGKTWTKIVNGIRADDYVHAVREDPTALRGCSTRRRSTASTSRTTTATTWESLSLNLPDIPVSDLVVEGNDLAIATHGRGFYILDDIDALRQFTPRCRLRPTPCCSAPPTRSDRRAGATIPYWLKHPAKSADASTCSTRRAK